MKDIKEPDFIEFEAPDTYLNDLEFNIKGDTKISEFKMNTINENFNFEPPEEIPEFNMKENIINTKDETHLKKAINKLETKIETDFAYKKTSLLKKLRFKRMFKDKY